MSNVANLSHTRPGEKKFKIKSSPIRTSNHFDPSSFQLVYFSPHTNLYLRNLGELAARKVDEGQVTEAQGYGRVALDKWSSIGICGQLLMNNGIMTKETSMVTESDTTQVTPSTRKRILLTLLLVNACLDMNDCFVLT